jgi:hypothetical protein
LTIIPRPKKPRSPPFSAEPGSCECCLASSANLGRLLNFLQHLFRLGSCLFLVRVATRQDQDVARAPLFGLLITLLMALVPGGHFGIAGRKLRQQILSRDSTTYSTLACSATSKRFGSLRSTSGCAGTSSSPDWQTVPERSPLGNLPLLSCMRSSRIDHRAACDAGLSNRTDHLLQRQILS